MERVQRWKEMRERRPDSERKKHRREKDKEERRGKKRRARQRELPHTDNTGERSQERVRNTRLYLQRDTETRRHSPTREKTEYTES